MVGGVKSLREFYRVGLTYTSNALEGNSLTETETKVVIEDGLTINGKPLRDVYEAVGHAKAYDHIHELAKSKTLEESDILKLHQLLNSGTRGNCRQRWNTHNGGVSKNLLIERK